jgi:putative ABC transport system permease protein
LGGKSIYMLRNILKIAIRILVRNKVFSLINILGISIGISCSLLIFTSVRHELSYDHFHENKDNLFVLEQIMDLGTGPYKTDKSGAACGPAIKDAFPGITDYIRFSPPIEALVIYDFADSSGSPGRKKFIENNIMPVDSNFLDHFSFTVLQGDGRLALMDPWSIVLTKESAEKYFGEDVAIGEVLSLDGQYSFTVSAVVDDPPTNSSIQFDFLVNFRFLDKLGYDLVDYNGNPFFTFLRIGDPDNTDELGDKISEFLDEYQNDAIPSEQSLVALTDFHQKGEQRGEIFTRLLSVLGIIILAIACINFMNLTTARYLSRTREVGVRKVVGARRSQLIRQFIGETMILVFIALNLSILTVDSALPIFNQTFQTEIDFTLSDPVIIMVLISVFLITSLVSGSYPAFFLSSIKAVKVFGKFSGSRKRGGRIRKTLVVIQFLFTIIFIIASIVNNRQFNLLRDANMVFSSENIIYFPVRGDMIDHLPEVKQEILLNPSVSNVTTADYVPRFVEQGELLWGKTSEEKNEIALVYPIGYDFGNTFGVELIEGRFFDENLPADSINSIVINVSVAEVLGYDEPLGQTFYLSETAYTIIGVVKNYVFNPLALGGDNVIFRFKKDPALMFIKTNQKDKQPVIDYIETIHEKFNPDFPYSPLLLDDYLDPVTGSLGEVNKIIYFFTIFGILISCMGLLGLSIFSTEQRTKEIGIRKALGASSRKVLQLVALDFLKLIFISLLIAIPSSILLVNQLLKQFAERITMGPGLFLMATLIVLLISLLTVSYQAIRSAWSNPARSLRYE